VDKKERRQSGFMRLRLNLCDVDVQLKINNWRKSESLEEWDDNWCDVALSLTSKYLNYDPSGEILMSGEVVYLESMLERLLNGTLEEDCTVIFAEPDLQFDLRVAKRLYDVPGKIAYRNGYVDVDIDADLIIHFWCTDGLGANTFRMNMDRSELETLHLYLQIVTGKINANDEKIITMVEKGLMLPE